VAFSLLLPTIFIWRSKSLKNYTEQKLELWRLTLIRKQPAATNPGQNNQVTLDANAHKLDNTTAGVTGDLTS
jgi:hypothetical protein